MEAWQFALQVVQTWRDTIQSAADSALLAQHGARTLLFAGAVLGGKLLRHGLAMDAHARGEVALLAATLIKAAFSGSLSHPQRALDFAKHSPAALWEGVDIFSDAHALNAADTAAGAEALAHALLRSDSALESLPVLALWDGLATHVLQDARAVVRCRVLRAHALTELGLLEGAHDCIATLLTGAGLPESRDPLHSGGLPPLHNTAQPPRFCAGERAGCAANDGAVALMLEGAMSQELAEWLGASACAEVALARCRWLQAAGSSPSGCYEPIGPADASVHGAAVTRPEKVRALVVSGFRSFDRWCVSRERPDGSWTRCSGGLFVVGGAGHARERRKRPS